MEVLIPLDHREDLPAILERIRRGERLDHCETERVRKDGSRIHVSVTVSPVRDDRGEVVAASTVARDITERKERERRSFHLAAIVESSGDAIISKTLDGIVQSWNRGAEALYGWTSEEAVGRHISLIVPDHRRDELDHIMERLRAGRRVEPFETRRVTRDGRELSISLTVSPVRSSDGSLLGASAIGRDITAQKQTEHALREAMERAEAASQAKDRFLATVSHELRTPLNAILGYASLMADEIGGPLTDDQRERMDRIQAGARHLISVIDEILAYSRVEAGQERVETASVDLRDLVEESTELLRLRAREEGLELCITLPDHPAEVRTDPGKIRQILLNLVGNAVKFTREGTVEVKLTDVPRSDAVVLRVRDTGPGMEPDQLERIFDPFQQGESMPTRSFDGTGLGLTVSRRLAELLGGELTGESTPGEGSVFTLTVPRDGSS